MRAVRLIDAIAKANAEFLTFGDAVLCTRADAEGCWRFDLAPIEGVGPHVTPIRSNGGELSLEDVLVK